MGEVTDVIVYPHVADFRKVRQELLRRGLFETDLRYYAKHGCWLAFLFLSALGLSLGAIGGALRTVTRRYAPLHTDTHRNARGGALYTVTHRYTLLRTARLSALRTRKRRGTILSLTLTRLGLAGGGAFARLAGASVMGLCWQQMAGLGHDLGHSGVTHNFYVDHLIGSVMSAFMGLSVRPRM